MGIEIDFKYGRDKAGVTNFFKQLRNFFLSDELVGWKGGVFRIYFGFFRFPNIYLRGGSGHILEKCKEVTLYYYRDKKEGEPMAVFPELGRYKFFDLLTIFNYYYLGKSTKYWIKIFGKLFMR